MSWEAHRTTSRSGGNNRQQAFFSNSRRRSHLALLAGHAARHELRILGYCLMPNDGWCCPGPTIRGLPSAALPGNS